MKQNNKKIGEWGEKVACDFLRKRGYSILATNVRVKKFEIDIIAKIKDIFVFIEVKTRTNMTYGGADNAITTRKIDNCIKAVEILIDLEKISGENIRLDLICVDYLSREKKAKIKHYKDII